MPPYAAPPSRQHRSTRPRRAPGRNRRVSAGFSSRHVETPAAAEQVTLKAGGRALREIRTALEARTALPSKKDWQTIQARLEAARTALSPSVQELREADEWQRWRTCRCRKSYAAR